MGAGMTRKASELASVWAWVDVSVLMLWLVTADSVAGAPSSPAPPLPAPVSPSQPAFLKINSSQPMPAGYRQLSCSEGKSFSATILPMTSRFDICSVVGGTVRGHRTGSGDGPSYVVLCPDPQSPGAIFGCMFITNIGCVSTVHTMNSSETLEDVGHQYGVPISQIMLDNGLNWTVPLRNGQTLNIIHDCPGRTWSKVYGAWTQGSPVDSHANSTYQAMSDVPAVGMCLPGQYVTSFIVGPSTWHNNMDNYTWVGSIAITCSDHNSSTLDATPSSVPCILCTIVTLFATGRLLNCLLVIRRLLARLMRVPNSRYRYPRFTYDAYASVRESGVQR